ncbi:class I SAM-dependent DNA methyltransferase [Nocardia sp. NPDC051570]|uniref:class I SAM-dependent DNA methyltransferase n=1 Tax=Nocardia sp. NPDC051570 TaxID=3364324 RepID=UPI0037A96254
MIDAPAPEYARVFADKYDAWFGASAMAADTVGLLTELAGPGPVLELGIGTGRIALPLREHGVDVHGVDGSAEMVASLRRKPGGSAVPITMGDFADVAAPGTFSLIYLASGTFFELSTQQDQLRCMHNVARRLRPGGVFMFDAFLPEGLCRPAAAAERALPTANGDRVIRSRTLHRVTQGYTSHYSITTPECVHRFDVSFRYAGMGELDLMAQLAGLQLRHRWGDWRRGPLTETSIYHVSCYEIGADHD